MGAYNDFNPHTAFDLILEITTGCKHSCTGCMVDKTGSVWPSDEDFVKLLGLVSDSVIGGMRPSVLTIGPTDILSSMNIDACLSDPKVKALADYFEELEIGCTFLSTKDGEYDHLAELLDDLMPGKVINFNVPFELKQLGNVKYIAALAKHVSLLSSKLRSARIGEIQCQSTFDMDDIVKIQDGNKDLIELFTRADLTRINSENAAVFTLSHGRRGFSNLLLRDNFINSALTLARYRVGIIAVPEPEDRQILEIIYANGKLYYRPFLVTEITCLTSEFEINVPWKYEDLINFRQDRMIEGLVYASTNPICAACQYSIHCAERGVHRLMQSISYSECLTGFRGIDDVQK